MINFKNISIEGFTSIVEPFVFELDRGQSLNVIRGKVGSGKTTIPNALTWSLYGQTLKVKSSIEPWEELRPENYRGVKVSTEFEKDGDTYIIIRCKNFRGNITIGKKLKMKGGNNTIILKNNEMLDIKGKVNIQKEIDSILGYSFELFKNSIVFGQKMKRIIEETGPEKKKVFEEAFDVGFINKAKDNTSAEKDKLVNLKKDIEHNLEVIDERLTRYNNSYNFALENENTFEENNKERIKEYTSNIKEIKEELKELRNENTKLVNIEELEKLKSVVERRLIIEESNNLRFKDVEKQLIETQRELVDYKNERGKGYKICSKCGGKINKDKASELNSKNLDKIKSLERTLSVLRNEYMSIEHIDTSGTKNEIKKLDNKISEGIANNKYNTNAKNRKLKFKSRIKTYEDKIEEIKNKKLNIKSTLYSKLSNKLIRDNKKMTKQLVKLQESINIKEWLINDPLSNNGLKAYMFDSLLGSVNDRLDAYEPILGFQIEFGIDLTSHRKDFYQAIMKDNIAIAYEDLSGGQQQLVNTAVAFAIHDVISEFRPINILFLDEPFESLDVDYIEVVSDLVYEKSKYKTLYLITHHQSFSPTNTNEINVTMENGHTSIS